MNTQRFRSYVHQQAFLFYKPMIVKAAQELIPEIKPEDIQLSNKVGIRAQLYNKKSQMLENDFICQKAENSTHVLNAISPAFTASFELADLILDRAGII